MEVPSYRVVVICNLDNVVVVDSCYCGRARVWPRRLYTLVEIDMCTYTYIYSHTSTNTYTVTQDILIQSYVNKYIYT